MKKLDVITIGGALEDITFFVDEGKLLSDSKKDRYLGFKLGSKVGINDSNLSLGGGACNVASGLASLGFKSAPLICLGDDDRGEMIIKSLKKLKVDTSLIQIDPKADTGFSFICGFDKNKLHVVFTHPGARKNLKINKDTLSQIEAHWVHISSLKSDKWPKFIAEAIKYKKSQGIHLSWNPGGAQIDAGKDVLMKYFKHIDVLFVNRDEAQEIVGGSKKPIDKNLIKLAEMGPKIVVITDGKNGAYVYDTENNKKYHRDAKAKKIADTTGAGDAFASGFIGGMLMYDKIDKALRLGIENSQSVLKKIGAQHGLLTKNDLVKIFR